MKSAFSKSKIGLFSINKPIKHFQISNIISDGEFIYYYQPIVDVDAKHNKIIGVESLIRFKKHDGRVLSPMSFISDLEESNSIVEITKNLILKAAKDFSVVISKNRNFKVSFNVSPSMLNLDLVKFFYQNFKRCDWIHLEITERSKIVNFKLASRVIHKLNELGIHVYLDDIGSGYGDNYYLQELEISGVKIDQVFTKRIAEGDSKVIDSYINMYSSLDLKIIGEGVETKKQSDSLSERGIHIQQGYHFYKPMPIANIYQCLSFESIIFDAKEILTQAEIDEIIE